MPVNVRDPKEIERDIAAFARWPSGGLIVTGSAWAAGHRHLIATLAAQHKLTAVYVQRLYVAAGGLISYGPNFYDQFRRAADYVDRILKASARNGRRIREHAGIAVPAAGKGDFRMSGAPSAAGGAGRRRPAWGDLAPARRRVRIFAPNMWVELCVDVGRPKTLAPSKKLAVSTKNRSPAPWHAPAAAETDAADCGRPPSAGNHRCIEAIVPNNSFVRAT